MEEFRGRNLYSKGYIEMRHGQNELDCYDLNLKKKKEEYSKFKTNKMNNLNTEFEIFACIKVLF